ncbi:MAG: leucine-rich repeat protein [Clostridia bacterium]|nr:leucine-rich repeat protein [Clostridia bacterium]
MKKLISIVIVAVMVFATFSAAIHVGAETLSGTCGANITWSLDTDSGVLTISGTGEMYNYTVNEGIISAPWSIYKSSIKTVLIMSGVTSVGNYSFFKFDWIETVIIQEGVISIGEGAFYGCYSLNSIVIPDSLTSLGYSALRACDSLIYTTNDNGNYLGNENNPYVCLMGAINSNETSLKINGNAKIINPMAFIFYESLKTVTIPEAVRTIGSEAFSECSSLTDVYYTGSEADWNKISIEIGNDSLTDATIHYNFVQCTEHVWDEGTVTEEPGCETTGIKTYTCTVCGETYTEEIAALEHDYYLADEVEPSCTERGYYVYRCYNCGDEYEEEYGEPAGHDYKLMSTYIPSCEWGGVRVYVCSACYDTYEEDYAEPLGHDFSEKFTVDKAPTQTAPGLKSRHCTRCSETTDKTEIPAIVYADADCDGVVSEKDILFIKKFISMVIEFDEQSLFNADVNGDGYIDMKDILAIMRMLSL